MSAYDDLAYVDMLYEAVIAYGWPEYIEFDFTEWARVHGYIHYYISRDGRIVSFMNRSPREMKPYHTNHGHLYVDLSNGNGYRTRYLVHRLVAEHFIDNPNHYPVVRHINDIPYDNDVDNLEWGTQADNIEDMKKNGNDPHRSVYCYELDKVYRSCADAADDLGVTRGLITMCCQGKVHAVKNQYHFCYLNDRDEKLKNPELYFSNYGKNYKKVRAINLETGESIIFESRRQAAKVLNIDNSGISNVIAGRISHVGRWYFEDLEER